MPFAHKPDDAAIAAARQRSEQLARDVVESAPNAIVIIDSGGLIELVNKATERVFGYARADLVGKSVDILVPARFRGHHPGLRAAFLANPQSRPMGAGRELYAERADGSEFPVEIGLNPIDTELGTLVLASIVDITARKQLENRFRQVVEFAPDAMVMIDADGKIELVNRQAERVFGYTRGELLGQSIELLVPDRFRNHHPALRGGFFHRPETRSMGAGRDLYGRRRDGTEFPVEIGLNPIETEKGMMVLSSIVDISFRKRLERQLLESTELLKATLDAAPFPILVASPDGTVLMWSAAGERVFGYTAAEMVGGTFKKLDPEETRDATKPPLAQSDGLTAARVVLVHKDGRRLSVNLFRAPIRYSDGGLRAVVSTLEDVTERESTESQLRQALKMEAIGNLTGGMAHDFNNLLGIIIGNLDILQSVRPDDDEVKTLSGEAMEAAVRGAELTRRMLAFARRQPLQPQRLDLNELVRNITKLFTRVLREDVIIELRLAEDLWPVIADPAQLEAALTNLATNARDAMPRGGRLTIATLNGSLDEDYAKEHEGVLAGEYALIEVSDTGTGMPAQIVTRIFEPFFTTKERDKGTGLGLAMVFGFVKQSGGHVNVYSEVGIGSTFRIYLPRVVEAEAVAGRQLEPDKPIQRVRGGTTVLAVEDNAGLRRVVVRQLRELGYDVKQAEGAAEALTVLEAGGIALLFTDVIMPGDMDGYELAREAAERWPSLKIVLTSGFPEPRMAEMLAPKGLRLLGKPYMKDDLASALREALDG